jgi:hypothetical protein
VRDADVQAGRAFKAAVTGMPRFASRDHEADCGDAADSSLGRDAGRRPKEVTTGLGISRSLRFVLGCVVQITGGRPLGGGHHG